MSTNHDTEKREIRFRAWDTKKQMMSGWPLAVTLNSKVPYMLERVASNGSWKGIPTHRFILMQFTGLLDKNGTPVFEGDIFKETYPAGYSVYIVRFGEYDNGQSYEDHVSGNGWYLEEHRYWPEYETDIHSFINASGNEVIGNVFEHPHLLESKV